MHRRNLTPHERSVLRQLEEQFRKDDPDLAERLRRMPGSSPSRRFAPWYWGVSTHLAIGVVLLLLGLFLTVDSAVTTGLALIGLAAWRWWGRSSVGSGESRRPPGRRDGSLDGRPD